MSTLWPDDVRKNTGRDGTTALMEGRHWYFVSRNLLFERPNLLEDHKIVLTDFIRESGTENVELLTSNIETIIARRPPTATQKLDRILRTLARRTQYQAGTITLMHDRKPVELFSVLRDGGVHDLRELKALLGHAQTKGLASYSASSTSADASIQVAGIIYVEGLSQTSKESLTGFVAMWFSSEMLDAYTHGIAPAIEANGYFPVRVDQRDFNSKVDDEIIAEIRRARFVVADFSCGEGGARGGVYFEAGFGLALDKPVIFTVRIGDLERVHFDTRQFNHIVWNDPVDLQTKLRNRIAATIPRK